ncbi:integrase catalytic domain-containing protein [Trichonephila clavipes]|nr:integrase catalytic domain-containing protein [Trichonephila clavipes]
MGISDTEKNMLDSDNDYISSFENNLKFNNGMYETKLFWEDKPSDLENNWAIAKRRFGNLSIKMQDNNWLYNEYKNIVKDQIKENIVEECSSHFETNSDYMPHSAVVRKGKETTKVRMVFDASSKDKGMDLQLHIFCDASPRAFGAVAYFRYVTANDDIYTSFITAKSRVSPLKKSDSSIALHWIKGKASNYKQFVSNRVIEIQSNSDPSDWHHCSGRENLADYVSRGANLETIINSQFWMHGPQWLRTTENWPKSLNCDFSSTDPCESEEQVFTLACELNTASIINLSKFSSLQKLLRVTSWVLRFVHNIRNRFNKRPDDFSTEEIDGAEKFWIQLLQRNAFAEEVNCLRPRKLLLKTSVILEFNPFLDSDELIRVGGRLQKSKFSYLQKHPIILPAKHYFVNLMVRDSHEKFDFSGVQVTAPLPALRVEQSAPFSVVGIDFGGPLYTKDENKHYIVLFTCAVTRALHLELVNNLTIETFLLALRRFISHRGLCSKILTDNAKTFKKSELELKNLLKIISDPTVKAFYASHKIYWQFIMERAPWWGGFYERLIRTVKLALRKTVGRATLFRDELETLLIEIEGVLNSRPLTYIFSEFDEPEPLTPSHMILGRRVNSLPPARLNFDSNLSNRKVLIKRFNYRERLLNMFWTKWSKEYICMLKSAHCVKPKVKLKSLKLMMFY